MRIVFDIEANGLTNPDKIWCIVCKNIDTGEYQTFIKPTEDEKERERFLRYYSEVGSSTDHIWIGHNCLNFDWPVLNSLFKFHNEVLPVSVIDTLIISKLADYSRKKHSIEDYGREFNLPKGEMKDFSRYDPAMIEYCKRDVDITHLVYTKYLKYINKKEHREAINLENNFSYYVVNSLCNNGFFFNKDKAKGILLKVEEELKVVDNSILKSFPKEKIIDRYIIPKVTKYGTISLSNIPKVLRSDTHLMTAGEPYPVYIEREFNPSSPKQVVEVLNKAGWRPFNKTKGHIETERAIHHLKYQKEKTPEVDTELSLLYSKLQKHEIYGWSIDEENLSTLPPSAPEGARLLARRILLESRRRTLTEWINLVQPDGRIHGQFQGIGAWTHRMAHQKPNTANISNEFDNEGRKQLYGKEFRQLWMAPKNRLLVGVDAEGIQLRIFAHYIDDKEFTQSLEMGKKEDKSDPHSLNQRILGPVCKTRQQAKRFIYALLLGGGIRKLTAILGCEQMEAEKALERLLDRYQGFAYLKREVIPKDAKRGWFTGLDGRSVSIPADTVSGRKHLAMSGYLQNGEKVVMARATLKWFDRLQSFGAMLVNFVHDEWQVECPNDMRVAKQIAEMMASSLPEVGIELGLKCKLAGSYWNDDHKDFTIGPNWYTTH